MKKIFLIIFLSLIFICPIGLCDINIQSYTQNYDLIDDYIDMARLYTTSADYEKALEYIETIDKISPNNPKILYEKAIILKNYNQPILARNLMQEIVQIAPEYKDSYLYREFFKDDLPGFYMPQNYDSDYYTKKGTDAYQEGKYEKALSYFIKAIQQRRDTETLNNLGKAYLKTGNKNLALKSFEEAIMLDVKNPQAYFNMAMYYGELEKDSKKQIHYLKHAIKLNSKNAQAFYQLGNVYYEKEMYETAIEYFRQALSKDDLYFDAYFALGSALYKIQNFEEAFFVFEKSLNVELDNPKVYEYLAKSAIQLKKYDKAKTYAENAISIQPSPDNYFLLVQSLYFLGEYNDALNILKTKIADSKNSQMYNYIGLCNYQLNNYSEAINNFKKALAITEKPIYFYNLAVCYNTINDKTNMNFYLDKALKASPKDIQDYLDIIKIYQDLGKNDQIITTLDKALLTYPKERQFYNMKLQALKQLGRNSEYNTFKVYMNSKFPKDSIYLGKDNAQSR